MGNQVSFRGGLPNIPLLRLTADEGVKGIVGQGRMGVSGLGVFIAAARGVRGEAVGVRGGDKGGTRAPLENSAILHSKFDNMKRKFLIKVIRYSCNQMV